MQLAEKQTRQSRKELLGEILRTFMIENFTNGPPEHSATFRQTATVFRQRKNGNGRRAAAKATLMPEAKKQTKWHGMATFLMLSWVRIVGKQGM